MSEGTNSPMDPAELWGQWYETSTKMWSNVLDRGRESYVDPYGLYQSWLKIMEDSRGQMQPGFSKMIDPREAWKQWFDTNSEVWRTIAERGRDPLGLTTLWVEMLEEARAKMMAGGAFPADPFTFFKEWYDATSETWSKMLGDVLGTEKFVEASSKFMESYTSFYQTFRHATEEFFRNLQLPTRSDLARIGELVIGLEDKVDRVEDALEDFEDSYAQVATSEAVGNLERQLGKVESKLDQLPAAFEKSETVSGLQKRMGGVESKLDQLPAAFEKIKTVEALAKRLDQVESKLDKVLAALEKSEVKEYPETVKSIEVARRKVQGANLNTQEAKDK